MEARPEPSGSAEMLSSGPRPALSSAALWQLPSAASLTTGKAAQHTLKIKRLEKYIHSEGNVHKGSVSGTNASVQKAPLRFN